jgi:ADP-ribose pyrophosphatase YjhB (NUDIX family)/L-amino acid N-acyltransferase YncA
LEAPIFCPRCGSELTVRHTGERSRPVCRECGFIYYLNPTVAAGALVEEEGRVVLVRRKADPRAGYWGLPAGYVEADESAEDAAIRETLEEVGLHVELDDLLGVYSYGGELQRRGVLILYAAHAVSGELRAGDDAAEAAFFAPHELPPDSQIAFRTHRQALHDWRRARAVVYRPATLEEAEAATAINRSHGELARDFVADVQSPEGILLAAVDDGQLVGFASVTILPEQRMGRLNQVFVLPRYRRWGIGSELIRRSIAFARDRRVSGLLAEVEATNPAMVVYIKLGFRVSGFLDGPVTGRPSLGAVLFLSRELDE